MAREALCRVQPTAPAAYDAAKAYGIMERVTLDGDIWECAKASAAGQGPTEAPENWFIVSNQISAKEFAAVKDSAAQVAEAVDGVVKKGIADNSEAIAALGDSISAIADKADNALPKTGGEISGRIYTHTDVGDELAAPASTINIPFGSCTDKNGNIVSHFFTSFDVNGDIRTILGVDRRDANKKPYYTWMGLVLDKDYKPRCYGPHPRENSYSTDLDTVYAATNRHPLKAPAARNFFVGGDNASDTANLFTGRGLTSDMPFASLAGAINFITRNYAGCSYAYLKAQGDLTWGGETFYLHPLLRITLTSDINATITFTNPISIASGNMFVTSIKCVAPNPISTFFISNGHYRHSTITLGDVEFSGTVTAGTLQSTWGAQITASGNLTGNVTGPRYSAIRGSRILTGGKGPTAIPGTIDGTCDASSVYA